MASLYFKTKISTDRWGGKRTSKAIWWWQAVGSAQPQVIIKLAVDNLAKQVLMERFRNVDFPK